MGVQWLGDGVRALSHVNRMDIRLDGREASGREKQKSSRKFDRYADND